MRKFYIETVHDTKETAASMHLQDTTDAKTEPDAHLAAWRAKYGHLPDAPHADSVELDYVQLLLIISMSNGRRVVIPLEDIPGLADATPEQLVKWEMIGLGEGMEWPQLGVSYSVHYLIAGRDGNQISHELQNA